MLNMLRDSLENQSCKYYLETVKLDAKKNNYEMFVNLYLSFHYMLGTFNEVKTKTTKDLTKTLTDKMCE